MRLPNLFPPTEDPAAHLSLDRRSEEVADIVTDVPHWVVRGGTGLLLFFVCASLSLTWLIRFPDVVDAPIVFMADPAPAKLTARVSGRLAMVRQEGDAVQEGALLAYIETPIDFREVLRLEGRIRAFAGADPRQPQTRAELRALASTTKLYGPLQPQFEAFSRTIDELEAFYALPTLDRQLASLEVQIRESERLRPVLAAQRRYSQQEVDLAEQAQQTSANLHSREMLSSLDLAASEGRLLQQLRGRGAAEAAVINNDLQIHGLEQRKRELGMTRSLHERTLALAAEHAQKELLTAVELWKDTHLLIAPRTGTATYHRYQHQSPFVSAGAVVLSVAPDSGRIFGQIEIPATQLGKVKVGHAVRTSLDNYPAPEFGYLEGRVAAISLLPIEGKYRVDVALSDGLTTTHGHVVDYRHEMTGSSRIVTEDLRLLERVFYQFRRLWN